MPLEGMVSLQPSAKLQVCVPKLTVVNRKEAVPISEERVEPACNEGKFKDHWIFSLQGEGWRREGVYRRNRQAKVQVRLNFESWGHSVKASAGRKTCRLLDALSHIATRVGTACVNLNTLEAKPTAGEGSRVRNLHLNRCITLNLMSLFLKSVIFMTRPTASLDGCFS